MGEGMESNKVDIGGDSSQWLETRDGTVDFKGLPAVKADTGVWRAVPLIWVAEFCEKGGAFGVGINLMTYLVVQKRLPIPRAANLNANFNGTSYLTTLLGAFIADTWLGRYSTIAISMAIQILGFLLVTLSAALPKFKVHPCQPGQTNGCNSTNNNGLALINAGLYIAAFGTGGIKSSVSPLGADQFEKEDPSENKWMPNYFNWLYFCTYIGAILAVTVVVWTEENPGFAWGFGSVVVVMGIGLVIFLGGTRRYRYQIPKGSPLTQVAQVVVAAIRNRNLPPANDSTTVQLYQGELEQDETKGKQLAQPIYLSKGLRFLNNAAMLVKDESLQDRAEISRWKVATVGAVEDTKLVVRLLPIAATTFFFWTAAFQTLTFSISQSQSLDRKLGPNFLVPAGSVQIFQILSLMSTLVVYDRLFLPVARRFTGTVNGITSLQRIGTGIVCSIIAMACSALVEMRRLQVIKDHNLQFQPHATIPMTFWWLLPQHFMMGMGEAFMYPGQLDFFYSEAPVSMRSIGTSFAICTLSIGAFGSSAIVDIVNDVSKNNGAHDSGWLRSNLNISHLDRFYWLLAVLLLINFVLFLICAWAHRWKNDRFQAISSNGTTHETESTRESRNC